MHKQVCLIGALTVLSTTSTLYATITLYSDRGAFEAAAGDVATQDFESFAPAAGAFLGTPYDFGGFSALNETGAGGGDIINSGLVNASVELVGQTSLGGAKFKLIFDNPITALGFDAANIADQRTERLSFDNDDSDSFFVNDPLDQTRFWGFISDSPFTTFTMQVTATPSGTDGFRIDDVTYSAVPEPVGLALLATIFMIAFLRRRA